MVQRRARQLLGSDAAAQDAMQEVFLKVLHAGDDFRREASAVTWLYRIVTNHCLNVIRDDVRHRELLVERSPAIPPTTAPTEDRLTLRQLLAAVPEELREIAIYYYVDQMNQDEIAQLLGLARSTVGNRLAEFRARASAEQPCVSQVVAK
jgi:RNA polymerase sigma-70 factor (ECF subfamily)